MFDANMAHLPKYTQFLAKVNICKEGSCPHDFGIREYNLIECVMLDDESDNPSVLFKLNDSDWAVYSNRDHNFEFWCQFEGLTNGDGFICNDSKKQALEILGGQWRG